MGRSVVGHHLLDILCPWQSSYRLHRSCNEGIGNGYTRAVGSLVGKERFIRNEKGMRVSSVHSALYTSVMSSKQIILKK